MDSTDIKILKILQENGRVSMKELGKQVSLTSPAVSERVKRLEEKGIITGYKAVVNPNMLNKSIKAFINIAIKSDKYKTFLEYVPKKDYIYQCHHITGGDCMTIQVMVRDMEELENVIDDLKKFGNTETNLILSSPVNSKIIMP
jgi:Lrp/AsnC family leucine-responsive transcriptional regulator